MASITPLADRVVIQPQEAEEKTQTWLAGGLKFKKLVEVKKKFGTVKNYADTKNSMSGTDMLKNIEADVLI